MAERLGDLGSTLQDLPFLWLYPLFLGLVVGSYLNVVVHRLPLGLSTVRPASHCPGCGTRIRPWDNVPVLSFVLLRGRCRDCQEPIGWRYPAIELATGLLFVAALARFGPSVQAWIAALFISLLLVLAFIDLDHYILPNRLTYPGLVIGLLLSPLWERTTLYSSLVGAAVGAAVILLFNGLWWVLRKVQGFGVGDAKMLAMIGAFLGPAGVAVTLVFASLMGAATGLLLMLRHRLGMQSKLPFGTFLTAGALVTLFFGPGLVNWYLG